jgi:hypothetical protein
MKRMPKLFGYISNSSEKRSSSINKSSFKVFEENKSIESMDFDHKTSNSDKPSALFAQSNFGTSNPSSVM